MADGDGLRRGVAARLRVTFTNGDREMNLAGRTVSVVARFVEDVVSFTPSIQVVDEDEGQADVVFSAAQLNQSGLLALEFTITGSPVVNSNAKPLFIPVREPFAEAV